MRKLYVRTKSIFCANPKIGLKISLCFRRALTWHIRSQDFEWVSLRLQPPIPKAECFSGQFSELNSSGFREKPGYPAIDHTLESRKEW